MTGLEERFMPLIRKLNKYILSNSQSGQYLLNRSIKEIVNAGGKRLRPLLVILSAKLGDYREEKIFNIASAFELLHTATLVHDDIIDRAILRRNKLTLQKKFGRGAAIFVGDFLLNRAFTVFTEHLSYPTLRQLNKVEKLICEGEVRQYEERFNYNISVYEYLRRIRRKTAVFFGFSTFVGAYESGIRSQKLNILYNIGLQMGMAFQIQDDIFDYVGNKKKIGKAVGKDLNEGIATLPVICLLQDKEYGKKARKLLSEQRLTEEDKKQIVKMIKDGDSLKKSRRLSKRYFKRAVRYLNLLPDRQRRDLEFILNWQMNRNK